ncbi:hypothetical protein TNCV_2339511 [Trichonephila clavipes]|nr:hypothetical protein TNCV_2339511 [Trichonephila clavipes]
MRNAIDCDSNNATASGVADALCSDVREHSEKYATWHVLHILLLNINGTQRKTDELSCLLHDNNVHVACLQETKINPNLNLNKLCSYSRKISRCQN